MLKHDESLTDKEKVKLDLYKILRMSVLLSQDEVDELTLSKFKDASINLDKMYTEDYEEKLESMFYSTSTLEEEVERLKKLVEFIKDRILQSPCNTIDEYIDFYINNLEEYKRYYYCAPIIGDLKIMYDGTLLECQNSIYDKNMSKDEVKLDIASQSRWILHDKFQINLLTLK